MSIEAIPAWLAGKTIQRVEYHERKSGHVEFEELTLYFEDGSRACITTKDAESRASWLHFKLEEDCEHGYRAAGGSYFCPACEAE